MSHFDNRLILRIVFLAHFCGHQHEPHTSESSEAGAGPRRLRQGSSLFGLEKWGEIEPKQRIHGYTAGQYIFEKDGGFEKLWPRIAINARHGGLHLAPDHSFLLGQDDAIVTQFDLSDEALVVSSGETTTHEPITNPSPSALPNIQLLDAPPDERDVRLTLAKLPKLQLVASPQHRHVRQEEQSEFEHALRTTRCVWLVADWGSGNEGFLGASLERFRSPEVIPDVFHLRCDDARNVDSLEGLFPQQFGMPLQTFCRLLGQVQGAFLVLDGIHPDLACGEQLIRLKSIATAVLDYCPDLCLILVCRLRPEGDAIRPIELHSLDVPDTRTYLIHHPDATSELREAETSSKSFAS